MDMGFSVVQVKLFCGAGQVTGGDVQVSARGRQVGVSHEGLNVVDRDAGVDECAGVCVPEAVAAEVWPADVGAGERFVES